MQGDTFMLADDPVCVITHACSMRQGPKLHDTQMVAPILNRQANWHGDYDWMPLPEAPLSNLPSPSACLRQISSVRTEELSNANRVVAMAATGIHLLQQRMVHHLSRVIVSLAEFALQSAPIIAEVDLHEEWVTHLGAPAGPEFDKFLEADDRKLRRWLKDMATRHQAIQAVNQEIRRRSKVVT